MLDRANLSKTRPRLEVLGVLLQARMALNRDQIAAQLARKINKVTIYRVLAALCRAKIVHKAFTHNRAAHYELSHNCSETQCHPHFTCTNCGLTHCLLGQSLPLVQPLQGFIIHRQQVKLEGLCPKCA